MPAPIARTLVLLAAVAPVACALPASSGDAQEGELARSTAASMGAEAGTTTPVYASPADDLVTSVSVRNGMTLSLHAGLRWHSTSGGEQLILQGSTSQTLTFVQGFIPDDAFGTATQLGPKSFQLVLDNASDIDTVLSGSPFYLQLTTHSTAGDTSWSAQVLVAPRLVPASGTTTPRLALGAAITPTKVTTTPEGLVYRGTVTTNAVPQWLTVTSGSGPTLVQDAPHAWHFDWDFSHFESAAPAGAVEAQAKFGATTSTRDATVEVRVAKVGLAVGASADDIYGFPTCDPAVLECLRGLPTTTTDFGACGAYLGVTTCLDEYGFPVP